MQRYSLIHLRCGTAFLLWVMVVAILVFAFVGKVGLLALARSLSRILLLPLIAGIAYEVIRLAARFGTNPVVHLVLLPGLWLQRLTTREPSRRPGRGLDRVAAGGPRAGRRAARAQRD